MNNDLSKLSDNEIRIREEDILQAENLIGHIFRERESAYREITKKRWANPIKILTLKREMDDLEKAQYLLNEYSRTLTDESNRRMK